MILEREFYSPATVTLIRNCGEYAHVSCTGLFDDQHWEEFEDAAEALN